MSDLGRLVLIRVERESDRQVPPGDAGRPAVRLGPLSRKFDTHGMFPRASSTSGAVQRAFGTKTHRRDR
jgi:hypothetical protein